MSFHFKKSLIFLFFIASLFCNTSLFAADDEVATPDEPPAVSDEDSATTTVDEPVKKTTTVTKTSTTTTTTGNSFPNMKTVLSDKVVNDEPQDEKDKFNKETDKIYVVVTTDEVKANQKMKAVWIADDTHGAAPDNYKIDEKTIEVGKEMGSDKNLVATFSLSKPNAGWSLGQYHVDIYVDDVLAKTVKFQVE